MDFEDLRKLATGFQPAQLFLTALELGVFECLGRASRTAEELAQALQLDPRATRISLNGLVALDLLERDGDRYSNGEAALRYLVPDSGEYRGSILRHLHATWQDWEELGETWRKGLARAGRQKGQLPADRQEVENFILGMENLTRELAPHLADRMPVSGCRNILDLGGGPGNYALAFAQAEPAARVVHFDLGVTTEIARRFLLGREGADRISFREGDFLKDDLGGEYDFVWASQIIHMLGEASVQRLIERVAVVMADDGILAIHDHFLDSDWVSPPSAALFGVHMLAVTREGRTYSMDEVERWLEAAGIQPEERIDYGGASRILLGRKGPPR